MSKIHMVNHTHWDREWYFTTMDAIVLSDHVFTEILNELEENKDAKFCLDGQVSIIEEYLSIRPEKLEQIKKLVKENRLFIGPWYTQTDAFLVSGESIIRNLTIGIHETNKIGKAMKIGYLPDTFGFNAQMPTILSKCGIDNIIFWRGIDFDKHVKSPYFIWKGLSDEKIYAANLINGYGAAAHLNVSKEYREKRLFPLVDNINYMSNLENILVSSGGDQLNVVNNLGEKLNEINKHTDNEYIISSYEEFIATLRKDKDILEEYTGEFREPRYTRIHKSIASVHYDIKKANFDIEQKLINRIEPLCSIAKSLDIDISKNLITMAWKKVMEGQAHDGMGACVTDTVAVDVLHRISKANEIADGVENFICKKIAERIGISENEIIIFNTLPYKFYGKKTIKFMTSSRNVVVDGAEDYVVLEEKQYDGRENVLQEMPEGNVYLNEEPYFQVTALIKVELPAMGYKVFKLIDSSRNKLESDKNLTIENEFYNLYINEGKLNIKSNFGKEIEDFIYFENCGNDGDTYDFSPLRNDENIVFRVIDGIREYGNGVQSLILNSKIKLPKNLESRINKEEFGELDVTLKISLKDNSELIECKVVLDNKIDSHRLRVGVKSRIEANESIASVPFGYIRRPILNGNIPKWEDTHVEMPIDIEVLDTVVGISDNKDSLVAYTKGIKEYQVIKDVLYLTLLSTTGQLGKPDLLYRPGRASGDTTKKGHVMIETPLAQQHGISEFEFAISLKQGEFNERNVEKEYEIYTAQNISYQMQVLNKFINRLDNKIYNNENVQIDLNGEYSLLSVDDNAIFSAFLPSMKEEAALLRLKNSSNVAYKVDSKGFNKFKKWIVVNNLEEEIDDNELIVKPYNMLTIKLWY